jgi:hypothetical protein
MLVSKTFMRGSGNLHQGTKVALTGLMFRGTTVFKIELTPNKTLSDSSLCKQRSLRGEIRIHKGKIQLKSQLGNLCSLMEGLRLLTEA